MQNKLILTLLLIISVVLIIPTNTYATDQWDRPFNTNVTVINNITVIVEYNDTNLTNHINNVNISLIDYIDYVNLSIYNYVQTNYYNISTIDTLYSYITTNFTYLFGIVTLLNSSIKQPTGKYLQNDSYFFQVNETELNRTINNISKIRHIQYVDYVNVTSGSGVLISNQSINYLITNIKVNGLATSFRSEVTEYPTISNIIDKDRIPHNKNWSIEKNYAINSTIQINITNSNNDGIFQVVIDYLQNGVE